jgi:hypothetical protein
MGQDRSGDGRSLVSLERDLCDVGLIIRIDDGVRRIV